MSDPKVAHDANKYADEINRRAAERAHDNATDMGTKLTEAATKDAQEVIKAGLLINGGAAVAILAFVSSFASKAGASLTDLRSVTWSLFFFSAGVGSAGVTAACAYFANGFYAGNHFSMDKTWQHPYVTANEKSKRFYKWGRIFHYAGIALAALSIIMFIVGVYSAATAITSLQKHRLPQLED